MSGSNQQGQCLSDLSAVEGSGIECKTGFLGLVRVSD
jgi:hypothetical protein